MNDDMNDERDSWIGFAEQLSCELWHKKDEIDPDTISLGVVAEEKKGVLESSISLSNMQRDFLQSKYNAL